MRKQKLCPICKNIIVGRTDKKFCSTVCKSNYHKRLNQSTNAATKKIDSILHRNRSILLELMGKRYTKIKVPLIELESRKFNFNYMTKYIHNKQGKTYNYIYDFSYMTFSTNEVLIIRHRQ
jgi:hypothetical protein